MNNPDESVCFDHDVKVDGYCDRDIVEPVDATEVPSAMLKSNDTDDLVCLDGNVKVVEQRDVDQMDDPDESISLGYDVSIDG